MTDPNPEPATADYPEVQRVTIPKTASDWIGDASEKNPQREWNPN